MLHPESPARKQALSGDSCCVNMRWACLILVVTARVGALDLRQDTLRSNYSRNGSVLGTQNFEENVLESYNRSGLVLGTRNFEENVLESYNRSGLVLEAQDLEENALESNHSRHGKFFPFYTVVRFSNIECTSTNSLRGTCYLKEECKQKGGTAFGSCAKRLGVCCVVTRNCGGTPSNSNNTYFRSPGFPGVYAGGTKCTISIAKVRDAVCQVRLQFNVMKLVQPIDGTCVVDKLTVSGTDTQVPQLCGTNTGQQLYLRFQSDGSPIQVTILTNSSIAFERQWDIVVSQYECTEGAPMGCLQYHTGVAGTVTGFNYADTSTNTLQLVNQEYAVCVRPEAGYCGIEWSPSSSDAFLLTGDPAAGGALQGDACKTDFIIIPKAQQNLKDTGVDRFCGTSLIPTRSLITPMVLYVITDDTEPKTDVKNRGFQLKYRQIVCE